LILEEFEEVENAHVLVVSIKNLFGEYDEESRREDLMQHQRLGISRIVMIDRLQRKQRKISIEHHE
jgi:hypothetical protein